MSDAPALYMLAADREGGAEVYSAARTRDQAKIAFWTAQQMARRSPDFLRSARCRGPGPPDRANPIRELLRGGVRRCRQPRRQERPLRPDRRVSCASQPRRLRRHRNRRRQARPVDALGHHDRGLRQDSASATSSEPMCSTSSRGPSRTRTTSASSTPSTTATTGRPKTTWRKANPNFAVSVEPEHLAMQCRKAMQSPASQASFLTKHLNVWIQTDQALFDMRGVGALRRSKPDSRSVRGRALHHCGRPGLQDRHRGGDSAVRERRQAHSVRPLLSARSAIDEPRQRRLSRLGARGAIDHSRPATSSTSIGSRPTCWKISRRFQVPRNRLRPLAGHATCNTAAGAGRERDRVPADGREFLRTDQRTRCV